MGGWVGQVSRKRKPTRVTLSAFHGSAPTRNADFPVGQLAGWKTALQDTSGDDPYAIWKSWRLPTTLAPAHGSVS